MGQEGQEQSLIRLGQGVVGEPNLHEGGDVLIIHDGIHPSIMTSNQATSVSIRVRNTIPVQYHLVLEEATGLGIRVMCQTSPHRLFTRMRKPALRAL